MTNHTVNEELNKAFEEMDQQDDYDVNNSLIQPQSSSTPKGNLFYIFTAHNEVGARLCFYRCL